MSEKSHKFLLIISTLVLAYCSIVYELILGQSLSAFLGDAVLRYSVTIGLYLFSMGIGAFWAEGHRTNSARSTLVKIEFWLSFVGGGLLFFLHTFHGLVGIGFGFSLFAHSLIVFVGILTGFELPLLILLWRERSDSEGVAVIALNYLGALLGPITFALYFYPIAGLIFTSLLMGLLNALVGTGFVLAWRSGSEEKLPKFYCFLLPLLVVLFLGLLSQEKMITDLFSEMYLSR